MIVLAVFHGEKVSGLVEAGFPCEVVANAPVTAGGMDQIFGLVKQIREYCPVALYCSRLARAAGSASVLAIELDLDFQSMKELGQHGSKDGTLVCYYPGYEHESYVTWQLQGIRALSELYGHHKADTIVIVSHKPVIGGLIAYTRGISDEEGVMAVVKEVAGDAELMKKGFVVFGITDKGLNVVVG